MQLFRTLCVAVPGAGVAFGHGTDFEDVTRRGRQERRRESEIRERRDDWGSQGNEGKTQYHSLTCLS